MSKESADKARASLQRVNRELDDRPQDAKLWSYKGLYYETAAADTVPRTTRLERALLWHREAVRLEPGNWVHPFNCARLLMDLRRYEEARRLLETSTELAGANSKYPWEALIDVCHRLSLHATAADVAERARTLGIEIEIPDHWREFGDKAREQVGAKYGDEAGEQAADPSPVWAEAADPELALLDFDVTSASYTGLFREAEQLCIAWELTFGRNNLTSSFLDHIPRRAEWKDNLPDELGWVTGAYPAVEMAESALLSLLPFEVERLKESGLLQHVTAGDISETDDHASWLLSLLPEDAYRVTEPDYVVRPIPPAVMRVWSLATANFLIAQASGIPVLEAYTACTLGMFYERTGSVRLPLVLHRLSALAAEAAGQVHYALSGHGRCARILMDQGDYGGALEHLHRGERYAAKGTPHNRVSLWLALGRCYLELDAFGKAAEYYHFVSKEPAASAQAAAEAGEALKLLDGIARRSIGHVKHPVILLKDLPILKHIVDLPSGVHVFTATSEHEYYDALVTEFEGRLRRRKSLLGREQGFEYMEGYHQLVDALVIKGVELELASQALRFLEQQKTIILNSRVGYLLRTRPSGVPEHLWSEFEATFRGLREAVEAPPSEANPGSGATRSEIVEAVRTCLWKIRVAGQPQDPSRLGSVLGGAELPQKLPCEEPDATAALEFFTGRDGGVCFVVDPNDPARPEAIRLPGARLEAIDKLVAETLDTIRQWTRAAALGESPDAFKEAYRRCLGEADEILYRPLADALRERGKLRRLMLVPHRSLHALPLNLLGLAQGGESLAERFEVSFSPSLAFLASAAADAVAADAVTRRMLVASNSVPVCPSSVCRNPERNCFALAGAQFEGEYVAAEGARAGYEVRHLTGEAVTYASVSIGAREASVIHLACHNLVGTGAAEDSGVLLHLDGFEDGGRYGSHSGSITADPKRAAGDLLSLGRLWKSGDFQNCRLLHLSGCSTGMTKWSIRSDEFYGLANGFLSSGAASVVCSLWPADDVAALALTCVFYRRAFGGQTIGSAFSQAVADLRTMTGQDVLEVFAAAGIRLPEKMQRRMEPAKPGAMFGSPFFHGAWRIVGASEFRV